MGPPRAATWSAVGARNGARGPKMEPRGKTYPLTPRVDKSGVTQGTFGQPRETQSNTMGTKRAPRIGPETTT